MIQELKTYRVGQELWIVGNNDSFYYEAKIVSIEVSTLNLNDIWVVAPIEDGKCEPEKEVMIMLSDIGDCGLMT